MADAEEPEGSKAEAPQWEHKTEPGIHQKMREVIHLSISATEAEIKVLKRKLEKLQYGS